MYFNARLVALLLGLSIAGVSTAFLSLIQGATAVILFVTFSLSFSSAFLLIYFAFEYLVIGELNEAYAVLEKLKKKEFKIMKRNNGHALSPIKKLNYEIYSYASKKQKEIDHLKKLAIYRREFLADVSHELKTPIFAAQGFLHTLIDGAVDDHAVRYKFLNKAAKSLDGLHNLVEDLFTLSRMEVGILKMDFNSFAIRPLIEETLEQLEKKAAKRNIGLSLDSSGPENDLVFADRTRMHQVISNLVENAIKYGKDGGQVVIKVEDEAEQIVIQVEDNGPGIDTEHLDRIFERFYRIEKSRSKTKGGSGLGLAIVKHIVEAHGSRVNVASKVKKGTQFTFRLNKPPYQSLSPQKELKETMPS